MDYIALSRISFEAPDRAPRPTEHPQCQWRIRSSVTASSISKTLGQAEQPPMMSCFYRDGTSLVPTPLIAVANDIHKILQPYESNSSSRGMSLKATPQHWLFSMREAPLTCFAIASAPSVLN